MIPRGMLPKSGERGPTWLLVLVIPIAFLDIGIAGLTVGRIGDSRVGLLQYRRAVFVLGEARIDEGKRGGGRGEHYTQGSGDASLFAEFAGIEAHSGVQQGAMQGDGGSVGEGNEWFSDRLAAQDSGFHCRD